MSSFYLISYLRFPGYCQLIAEIFFVLLIMLIISKSMESTKKSLLSVIFAISLIVSHYGLSYLIMFSLIFVLFVQFLTKNQTFKRFAEKAKINRENKVISLYFVLLYIVFILAWYRYTSSSSAFNTIIHINVKLKESAVMGKTVSSFSCSILLT